MSLAQEMAALLKERGLEVKVGRFPFAASGRALTLGQTEGAIKVVADARDDTILGVHMVGPRVTDVIAEATRNCYLRSEAGLVAAIGVEDLVVVATDDAVMVAPRNRTQEVKNLVTRLLAERRDEADALSTVHRPWGTYRALHNGHRVQVKHIMVKPGAKLSLQMHHHRAEHWVVVQGTAKIVRGTEEMVLTEDQSTYIPLGTAHRLENPGKIPLHVIEVQSGSYLGEDDIVRLEDHYGRA